MTRSTLSPARRAAVVPLTVGTGDAAGQAITGELPPELALPIWQALQCVLRWAMEEPALRGDLFESSSMLEWEGQLLRDTWAIDGRAALVVIVGELARPAEASPGALAHSCLCVANWALLEGYPATALGYVEAAGLCMPEDPRYAWIAGRFLRSYGRAREAAIWLKRAERTSAARNDRAVQIQALNSLGNLHYHLTGDFTAAAKSHREALRLARKHQQLAREGELLHDLFIATWYSGEADAEDYARQALDAYAADHPRLPALAHDLAFCWMVEGHYARAATVLREAIPHLTEGTEPIRALAAYATAIAGCGDTPGFASVAKELWSRVGGEDAGVDCGTALVELARGATNVMDWPMARSALERAIEILRRTATAELRVEAEELLISVEQGVTCAPVGRDPQRGYPLATDLVLALRERITAPGAQSGESGSTLN